MVHESLTQLFFFIFSGAAILATLALFGRQPLIIAYIALGVLIGPYSLQWVTDIETISSISEIGIIFLLFLLGLDMQPKALVKVLRQATQSTMISSILFGVAGYSLGYIFGFSQLENLIIGVSMIFSSTIIGIKLLPTTALHHKHSGELMVGMLLMQDFLAIIVLLFIMSGNVNLKELTLTLLALPLLVCGAFLIVRFLLLPLFIKFEQIGEYIFLIAIGWCLGTSEAAAQLGLSREIGAFIAGISIATCPLSKHIALSLKPLRDFFLILFFFSLGSGFNINLIPEIGVAVIFFTGVMLAIKPLVYFYLLRSQSESPSLAWDIGFRLGQNSEFSLLIAYMAFSSDLIGTEASHLIQAVAIMTFIFSSYIVVLKFPTPISTNERLRRD
ncbi:MAG: sodium:proton antiporter [Porticoccaceae bacterium]|nr:sodium:proton antiporter [Porticoccaceae bacterium]|tara:strand:+ start:289 stop:1449 length:1161 start_codon:yes stop_codon:yes gene_type:complete